MKAGDLITTAILPLQKSDRIASALTWMNRHKLPHLPVVHRHMYIGMIQEDVLLGIDNKETSLSRYCSNLQRPFIPENEHYYYVLRLMAVHRLLVLPVLNDKENYLGLITRETLIGHLSESLSVHNPGGIIVLEVKQTDLSFGEIARIVESNDTKILSTSVKSKPDSDIIEITLKLNRINIQPVMQTFYRFQYDIVAYFGDNQNDEDLLLERYDALMSYLNI